MRKDKEQRCKQVKGKMANMLKKKIADLLFCGLSFR